MCMLWRSGSWLLHHCRVSTMNSGAVTMLYCSYLLWSHLIKILVNKATIVVEGVTGRLWGVWIRSDWRRIHLIFISHLVRAICKWFWWEKRLVIFLDRVDMDWALTTIDRCVHLFLSLLIIILTGVLVWLCEDLHLNARWWNREAFHLLPWFVNWKTAENFVMCLRFCFFFQVIILVSTPLEHLAVFLPQLLLLLPMLLSKLNQVLLCDRFKTRNVILAQGKHLTELRFKFLLLSSCFESFDGADFRQTWIELNSWYV